MSKEKPAFVFPGQGSQEVGMGEEIYRDYGVVQELFRRADEVLKAHGWTRALREFCLEGPQSLTELCFKGPKEVLDKTQFTQPTLYVTSLAYCEVLKQDKGVHRQAVAGHSLGEYTALTEAGFLDFEDGVRLVADRGCLMAEAGEENPGKMVVILGQELSTIEDRIAEKGLVDGVFIANINCPGQIVLSGYTQPILELAQDFVERIGERRTRVLDISIAAHCKLMGPAAKKLRQIIEEVDFKQPKLGLESPVRFYSSTAAMRIDDPAQIKELLVAQLTSRVLWAKTVQQMIDDGYTHFIEVGPGNVLSGLIRRTDRRVKVESVGDYL